MFGDLNLKDLAVAEQEVPHDVNPLDPDDEVHYFGYNDWRDVEDALDAMNADIEEMHFNDDGWPDPDEVC